MISLEAVPHETDLQALVYVSTATHLLTREEIDYLLQHAQARNAEEAVTGVLLYYDGSIIQYLEGPMSGLAKVYQCIQADPLHHGIIELLREPIQARVFPEWSMAFRSVNQIMLAQPTQLNERLSQRLNPLARPMSRAHLLITKLWNKGRPI